MVHGSRDLIQKDMFLLRTSGSDKLGEILKVREIVLLPLSERKVCERSSEWRDALDFFAEMQRRKIQQEGERKDQLTDAKTLVIDRGL